MIRTLMFIREQKGEFNKMNEFKLRGRIWRWEMMNINGENKVTDIIIECPITEGILEDRHIDQCIPIHLTKNAMYKFYNNYNYNDLVEVTCVIESKMYQGIHIIAKDVTLISPYQGEDLDDVF